MSRGAGGAACFRQARAKGVFTPDYEVPDENPFKREARAPEG